MTALMAALQARLQGLGFGSRFQVLSNGFDGGAAGAGAGAGPTVVHAPSDPLSIAIEEKIHVVLNKNGGLEDFEVNGTVFLQVPFPLIPP